MTIAKPISAAAFDLLGAAHETAPRVPIAFTLTAKLRKAVTAATAWVTGASPDLARTRHFAQATDLADLERRIAAWEAM